MQITNPCLLNPLSWKGAKELLGLCVYSMPVGRVISAGGVHTHCTLLSVTAREMCTTVLTAALMVISSIQ